MAATDFKFISPGVFINEIDNSQLPSTAGNIGPVVIGRSEKGPGLVPTTVNSFQEFTEVFGAPTPGNLNNDLARNGNSAGPTYGPYAAQAWLRNNSPITFVRLVGQAHSDAVDPTGLAGWQTNNTSPASASAEQGGAYGLFVFQSSSAATPTAQLAAVWYVNSGSVALSGTAVSSSTAGGTNYDEATNQTQNLVGTNVVFKASGDKEFKVIISKDEGETTEIETTFNFTNSSEKFVRRVFNTNPTLTNSDITDSAVLENYWLGETYEDQVALTLTTGAADQYGVIIPLANKFDYFGGDFRIDYQDSRTGYFISQDLRTGDEATGSFDARNQTQLFRLRARNTGRWASRNIKVSIADIRASSDVFNKYGTFSVQIRAIDDTDNRPKILEQFNNCNLNPSSENYVARKIGDKFIEWDDEERRYREYGDFANLSKYVYVEATDIVKEGKANPEFLPFGVFGPTRFISATAQSTIADFDTSPTLLTGAINYYDGSGRAPYDSTDTTLVTGALDVTFEFPALRLRASASEGNPTDPRDVYFGVDTTFNRQGRPSVTIGDYTGAKPGEVGSFTAVSSSGIQTENMYVFTLDDMCNTDNTNTTELTGTNVYLSGSRQLDPSERSGLGYIRGDGTYQAVLDAGCDKFTTVFHGGFDGLDITEAEPFRNTFLEGSTTQTEFNNYAYNSLKVAIDSLRDPEQVQFDLACMPGITNNTLNRSLVDMCDDRGDAMAIIDLKGGYVPETENTSNVQSRLGSVASTVNNKKTSLQMNSSFGAAYYPWVQIQDTINGAILWAPPSVAALGAISYGQATQELWFAPAGFTRGGLSANNAAGIPVVGVRERLISKDRDKLYEANINPIAQFPAEGIVIFGQKTLQVTPSALDRINVRRLLIYLKREISRIAATLLFDQNVQATWNRFRGQVEPLLASVQAGLGLQDYKLVLDETTTTPDLIDRNIMYAQIFLKPTRAIEFIAIDFVITDSGASFDD
jgi:hypothetical protein